MSNTIPKKLKLSTNVSSVQMISKVSDDADLSRRVIDFFNSSRYSTVKNTSLYFDIPEEKVINILTTEMPNELSNWILKANEPELAKLLAI